MHARLHCKNEKVEKILNFKRAFHIAHSPRIRELLAPGQELAEPGAKRAFTLAQSWPIPKWADLSFSLGLAGPAPEQG